MSQNPIFLSLVLDKFKNSPCPNFCKSKNCRFFHNSNDQRRPFFQTPYHKSLCASVGSCDNQACQFAHNLTEQIYHPDNYKKKYCQNVTKDRNCPYRDLCAYAHSDLELKIVPLHVLRVDPSFLFFRFKSEFCPFKNDHDRFTCVYAHNWQDFKRPYFETLQPVKCPHWSRDKKIELYSEGCPDGLLCSKCHGWKELEYHPQIYKTQKCENEACARRMVCGFRHPGDPPFEPIPHDYFFAGKPSIDFLEHNLFEYFDHIDVDEKDYLPEGFFKKKSSSKTSSQRQTTKKNYFFGDNIAEIEDEGENSLDSFVYDSNATELAGFAKQVQSDSTIKIRHNSKFTGKPPNRVHPPKESLVSVFGSVSVADHRRQR